MAFCHQGDHDFLSIFIDNPHCYVILSIFLTHLSHLICVISKPPTELTINPVLSPISRHPNHNPELFILKEISMFILTYLLGHHLSYLYSTSSQPKFVF